MEKKLGKCQRFQENECQPFQENVNDFRKITIQQKQGLRKGDSIYIRV